MFTSIGLPFIGLEQALRADLEFREIPWKESGSFLFLPEGTDSPWLMDAWDQVEILSFQSISDAQKILKAKGPRWMHFSNVEHRRGNLISEGLNTPPSAKPLTFPSELEFKKFGVFSLLSRNELLVSTRPRSRIPFNTFTIQEDKQFPPNRAYLKLWELFLVHLKKPAHL